MAWSKTKKKGCKIALYSKIKERRETEGESLNGEHTLNIPYVWIATTQDKTKARKAPISKGKGA